MKVTVKTSHSSLLKTHGFLQTLPKIHTSHQYLEDLECLRLFSKCLRVPFLRPLRSKDNRGWILRLVTSKYCNNFWKFGCQPRKSSDLFDFGIFLFAILTRVSHFGTIKKTNKSELWNHLSYRGLPYFFEVGSQTFFCSFLWSEIHIIKIW